MNKMFIIDVAVYCDVINGVFVCSVEKEASKSAVKRAGASPDL